MTATVVVTFKTVGTGSDRNYLQVLHINVGSLQHIAICALHLSNGLNKILQVFGSCNLKWIFLGTVT